MDTITPEGPVSTGDLAMGNETSKIDIKHDLGDVEKPGQFHKVLVEPDYSVIESPTLTKETISNNLETTPKTNPSSAPDPISNNINHKDTATVIGVDTPETSDHGATDEQRIQVFAKEIVDQVVQNVIANGSAGPKLVNGDALHDNSGQTTDLNSNSETQNNQAEKNAIVLETIEGDGINVVNGDATESVKVEEEVNSKEETKHEEPNINKSQTKTETGADKEAGAKKTKGKNKQNSGKAKKTEKKLKERELVESVKEQLDDKQAEVDEKKPGKGKGFMKMFKFSKRKPLTVPADTGVVDTTDENHCNENSVGSKPLSENEDPKETIQVENLAPVSKSSEVNQENGIIGQPEQIPTLKEVAQNVQTTEEESHSNQTNTETNESLDSGIVVEKVQEILNDKPDTESVPNIESTQTISVDSDLKADNGKDSLEIKAKEPESAIQVASVNGVNEDGDVKEFNERGIDVGDITNTANKDINTVSNAQSVEEENKNATNAVKSSGPETGDSEVKELGEQSSDTQEQNKDKIVKIKRKSWSFQIGSSKKKADAQDTEVSKDSNKHGGEHRKPRWRLGKFSFRKSTSDVSLSTPDLSNSGIPEETTGGSETTGEKKEDKKKNKMKKIKSKKEKKKEGQSQESEPFERRSNSLFDILLGDNRRGSRRSIVEEEISFTETDAFEGVSLSDLSADEDGQVSKNPAGAESKPTSKTNGLAAKAKGLFKSDKKKSPTTPAAPVESRKVSERIKMLDNSEYAQIQDDEADVKIEAGVDLDVEKIDTLNVKASEDDTDKVETVANFKEVPGGVYAQIVKPDSKDKTEEGEQSTDLTKDIVEPTKTGLEDEHEENTIKTSDTANKSGQTAALTESCVTDLSNTEPNTAGHSNPVYGDESFTMQVLKSAGDVLKAGQDDSDSDAYVQLEDLVTEHKLNTVAPLETEHKPNTVAPQEAVPNQPEVIDAGAKTMTDEGKYKENIDVNIECLNTEKIAEKIAESHVKVEETVQPLTVDSCESTPQSVNNTKQEVLIMKEVGVQAPDIHMPLDIEKDFSFPSSSLPKVSIGVQVSNGSMTLDHAENSSQDGKKTSTSSNKMPAAYF